MNIGCVLMAAGISSRFGENKLLYEVNGRSLLSFAVRAAPSCLFARAVAVVSDARVAALCREAGYACVWNPEPERGQGASVALGTQAMAGMDAAMFCVADQPYLTRQSVERLLIDYRSGSICALSFEGRRGNPVIFPADLFAELAALSPKQTGRTVLTNHSDRLMLVEVGNEKELRDVDTKGDLDVPSSSPPAPSHQP